MDSNALTVTGVIATILSVIFAFAAMWNSRVRRRHLERLRNSENRASQRLSFRSVVDHPSPARPNHLPPAPEPTKAAPVFRQLGPHGDASPAAGDTGESGYVWE